MSDAGAKGDGQALVVVVAAVVLVVAGAAPWLATASGGTVSGYALAGLVREVGNEIEGVPPPLLGLAYYLVPLAALVVVGLAGLRTTLAWRLASLCGGAAFALTIAFCVASFAFEASPAWGSIVALAAAGVVTLVSWPRRRSDIAVELR